MGRVNPLPRATNIWSSYLLLFNADSVGVQDQLMDDPKFIMWKPVKRSDIAWNFEKFLITPSGNPFQR
jgi:glutathione peroxidase-family protein